MTITIHADVVNEVQQKLDRLLTRADRHNIPMDYSISATHPVTVDVVTIDHSKIQKIGTVTVLGADVTINCDQLICSDGWRVLAQIEHHAASNAVTTYNGAINPDWYTIAAYCDHCGTQRKRKITYIVEHADGTTRQIGKTCLLDYTGIDPATCALWAQIQDIVANTEIKRFDARQTNTIYPVVQILAYASMSIAEHGYRKSSDTGSTRNAVIKMLLSDKPAPRAIVERAQAMIDWLQSSNDTSNDYLNNVRAIVSDSYATISNVGRLAYVPVMYDNAHNAPSAESAHIGNIGNRIIINVQRVKCVSSYDGDYGTSYLYQITDTNNNIYVWRTTKHIDGMPKTIVGTVKKHDTYRGIAQTVVTRCKIA